MTAEEILKRLTEKFGSAIQEAKLDVKQPWAKIEPMKIVDVATFLRDHAETKFDFLRSLAGVDYKGELEVVYILFSYEHRHEFKLKVRVPTGQPVVPTVENVWPAANWYEREAYDLLGITFQGHSDLRRIMLPDDWEGHPLRKDYKEAESYHGVSTTREYLTGIPELPTHPSQRGS